MTNQEEIEEKEIKLKCLSKNIDVIIKVKQDAVEAEQNDIIILNSLKNNIDLTKDLVHDAKNQANQMSPEIFHQVGAVISGTMVSSGTVDVVAQESKNNLNHSIQHATTINATKYYVASGAYNLTNISQNNPIYFPNAPVIIKKYSPEDELDENIKYIKSILPGITPNISDDFDKFIREFRSNTPSDNKYADLIGFRSTLFHKWIFKYARIISGSNYDRFVAITTFITGGKQINRSDIPIAENMEKIWIELSEQDDYTPNSVKLGNVKKEYNEQLFRRIIAAMAALLNTRDNYIY